MYIIVCQCIKQIHLLLSLGVGRNLLMLCQKIQTETSHLPFHLVKWQVIPWVFWIIVPLSGRGDCYIYVHRQRYE